WDFFADVVFQQPSTPTLFNPYGSLDLDLDRPDAVRIRRMNLRNYLGSFRIAPQILLVGEAPGPRGCRFSGVPFTSEWQLVSKVLPFTGEQSSRRPRPYKESSATTFWQAMRGREARVFTWNCVPFHPHGEGAPLSVRAPTREELKTFAT